MTKIKGPTYYVRHPNETYSVADPQPVEQAEQEPVHWTQREIHPNERKAMEAQAYPFIFPPLSKAAMREVLSGDNVSPIEQAEQKPDIRATLAPPAPPEVYQMRSKEAYEAGWWEAQRQKAVSPIAPAQQAEQECKDCTRSHPHEEMSKCCELRTEIARLRHPLRVKELAEQAEQEPLSTNHDGLPSNLDVLPTNPAEQKPFEYLMEVTCTKCGATESGVLKFKDKQQVVHQEPIGYTSREWIDWILSDKRPAHASTDALIYKTSTTWSPVALYAAPVRTKDLTDDEILKIVYKDYGHPMSSVDISRAVIAADREKNK